MSMTTQDALARTFGTLLNVRRHERRVETTSEEPTASQGHFRRRLPSQSQPFAKDAISSCDDARETDFPLGAAAGLGARLRSADFTASSADTTEAEAPQRPRLLKPFGKLARRVLERHSSTAKSGDPQVSSANPHQSTDLLQLGSFVLRALQRQGSTDDSDTAPSFSKRFGSVKDETATNPEEDELDVSASGTSFSRLSHLHGLGRRGLGSVAGPAISGDEEVEASFSHFGVRGADRREYVKPCGLISESSKQKLHDRKKGTDSPNKPEDSHQDVYIRAPKVHLVETYFTEDGNIARVVGAQMMLCVKNGIPANQGKYVGVFQYFREQIHGSGNRIGLTVWMNGITVNQDEFQQYGRAVYSKIDRRTPTLGLYNRTNGAVADIIRIGIEELRLRDTDSIKVMRCFLETMVYHFYHPRTSIHSQASFLMVVHSEGGLILYRALKELDSSIREIVKKHIYVITLGAVRPIPNKWAVYAMNIYSKKDYAVLPFVKGYPKKHRKELKDDKVRYNIKVVSGSSDADERIAWVIDHAFLGDTYQKHLGGQIAELTGRVGFGP